MILSMGEHYDNAIDIAHDVANRYTYPVFACGFNKQPLLIASAIVVEIKSIIYLLTASHVIDTINKYRSSMSIAVDAKFITIAENVVRTKAPNKDHFDLAFFELSAEFVEENDIHYITERSIQSSAFPVAAELSFVHGFPCTKNTQAKALRGSTEFRTYSYSYCGKIETNDSYFEKHKKSKDLHICMAYGRSPEEVKGPIQPLKPEGMSGGGLWIMPCSLKPERIYLSGIFIEYHKNDKISFATKIEPTVSLILQTQKLGKLPQAQTHKIIINT